MEEHLDRLAGGDKVLSQSRGSLPFWMYSTRAWKLSHQRQPSVRGEEGRGLERGGLEVFSSLTVHSVLNSA
jgi:hypothetical protein